ncbi:MAG: SIS domain-containing protein [Candidatus Aminicenantes bacterium]|nr:SIS domain-containing protein [Candidatus Aminicenantes bacterium]
MKIIDAEKIRRRAHLLAALNEDPRVMRAITAMEKALRAGNKILAFGNGGSATQASHFAAELVNKFHFRRRALPALALGADMANITSIANDEDFRFVFSRQVEAFAGRGDVALGITTSGHSANVIQAFTAAREKGTLTIALAGSRVDALEAVPVDIVITVDAVDTPTIQEMHLFLLHIMAEIVENKVCGGKNGPIV